jgi:DNA-directed RNA polymerase subunit RPC12/RpoP
MTTTDFITSYFAHDIIVDPGQPPIPCAACKAAHCGIAPSIRCPHCGSRRIIEVETAVRRQVIRIDRYDGDAEKGLVVTVDEDDDHPEWDHVRYECGTCEAPLTIPDELDVVYG